MIELTRLNGNALVVNSDLIKFAEASPDTMLTLINGEKIMVRESCFEVLERVIAYRVRLVGESVSLTHGMQDSVLRTTAASAASGYRASLEPPEQESEMEGITLDEPSVGSHRANFQR
jgi:flagellar protein FlbD